MEYLTLYLEGDNFFVECMWVSSQISVFGDALESDINNYFAFTGANLENITLDLIQIAKISRLWNGAKKLMETCTSTFLDIHILSASQA